MKPYLQMYNLWGVVGGEEESPENYAAGDDATPAMIAERQKQQKDWARDDEAAQGAVSLKIQEDLWIHRGLSAKETWDNLDTKFGKTSQAQKYQWWVELSKIRIPGNEDPCKEFGRWDLLIDKLTKAELLLPELIQAWLLMERIPQVYNNIQRLLLGMLHTGDLSPEKIKDLLVTEWD
jgi:hypothetical protein